LFTAKKTTETQVKEKPNMGTTWHKSLSIGVPLIDMQHKQLLDQMDLLLEALNTQQDAKQITNIMAFLDMYVNNHFGYEEQCMHIKQCPAAGQNKVAHEYFQMRLKMIRETLEQKKTSKTIATQVLEELLSWFVHHIRTTDMKLGGCK
jgi:hemerythrin